MPGWSAILFDVSTACYFIAMLVSYSLTGSQTIAEMLDLPYHLVLTGFVFLLFVIIYAFRAEITTVISYLIVFKVNDTNRTPYSYCNLSIHKL